MKKTITAIFVAAAVAVGATAYVATPTAPDKYVIHTVTYGETMESIIRDANQNTNTSYDIREATATAVAKSKEIDGGVTSRQLKIGDRVAVPIYR